MDEIQIKEQLKKKIPGLIAVRAREDVGGPYITLSVKRVHKGVGTSPDMIASACRGLNVPVKLEWVK